MPVPPIYTMPDQVESIKSRLLVPVFAALALLTLAAVIGAYIQKRDGIDAEIQLQLQHMNQMFYGAIAHDTQLMNALLDDLERDPGLREAWQAQDRERLLQASLPLFEHMRTHYRITHLYFTDIERNNFLRTHQPQRYGDTIQRHTMQQAFRSGTTAHGIELGPLGTFTLRVVRPWRVAGELVGYIEVGEEIDHIISSMMMIKHTNMIMALDKKFLQQEAWVQGQAMLHNTQRWDSFHEFVLGRHDQVNLTPAFRQALLRVWHSGEGEEIPIGSTRYRLHPFPLLDAADTQVGNMILIRDISQAQYTLNSFVRTLLILLAVISFMLMAFFYHYIERIEKRLQASRQMAAQAAAERIETLIEANRIKSIFLANMSHEIRTPMNGVLGMLQMLKETPLTEEQAQYLETALSSSDLLLSVINDVLDFSRLESGQLRIENIDFDLHKLAHGMVDSLLPGATQKGLALRCMIEAGTPTLVHGDPTRLRQVLGNLLSNAIKFTEHGEVSLSIHRPGGAAADSPLLQFEVTDTGIGIRPELHEHIFKSFTQADDSITRRYGGTGLGLAISKQLVECMDGTIDLHSTPNRGSTFTFTLPLISTRDAPHAHDGDENIPATSRILITSHRGEHHLELQRILASMQIRHDLVTDIPSAIETLEQAARRGEPFNVMILDTMGLSGHELELARRLHNHPRFDTLKLILLAAHGIGGDAAQAKQAGFHGYLTPPLERTHILDCLQEVLHPGPRNGATLHTRHD